MVNDSLIVSKYIENKKERQNEGEEWRFGTRRVTSGQQECATYLGDNF